MTITTDLDTKRFIVGMNKATFGNSYDHDIGTNQFGGRPFDADSQNNGWETLNTSTFDPSPSTPWLSASQSNLTSAYTDIDEMAGVVDVMRVWLCERLESVTFSYDSGNNRHDVSGLDRTNFLPNILKILDRMQLRDIHAYFALFDPWNLAATSVYTDTKATKQIEYKTTRNSAQQRILESPTDFINKYLIPFLREIKDHPAFWGLDMSNEIDGFYRVSGGITTSSAVVDFTNSVSSAIKNVSSNIRIGTSLGHGNFDTIKTQINNQTHFDFHKYSNAPSEAAVAGYYTGKSNVNGWKTYVGEFGHQSNDAIDTQVTTLNRTMDYLWDNGYKGGSIWTKDFYDSSNWETVKTRLTYYKNRTV